LPSKGFGVRAPSPRPVAMRARRWVVRAHRWTSLGLLAWLVVISITGAWLVERHAIDGWLNPGRYDTSTGAAIGIDEAVEGALAADGPDGRVVSVTMPHNGRGVYQVNVESEAPETVDGVETTIHYVDPVSGVVNDSAVTTEGFTWWLYRGHMFLWQDHGVFGVFDPRDGWCRLDAAGAEPGGARGVVCDVVPTGDDMVAWFAVAWMVTLVTGLYLWYWPGVRRWATAFVVRRSRGRFAFHMSLHKATGLVVAVPLVVIAFTGAAFAFPKMNEWFRASTPATADFALWEFDEDLVSQDAADRGPIGFDGARAQLRRALPDVRVESISPPEDGDGYYAAWVTRGFSPWTREGSGGNVYVAVDQYSGDVLAVAAPGDGNVFDQAWDDYSFPLHTGDVGGPATRVVWVVIGLSPMLLGATGIAMWLIRRNKRRRRSTSPQPLTSDMMLA
jgi:uncharacterized iron-regulated membrane protein